MSNAMNARLDKLEKIAVKAIARTYNVRDGDETERFWIQKGIEGMRYAIATEREDSL